MVTRNDLMVFGSFILLTAFGLWWLVYGGVDIFAEWCINNPECSPVGGGVAGAMIGVIPLIGAANAINFSDRFSEDDD